MEANLQTANTGLVLLLQKNNISEEMALEISPAFTELYEQANEWNKKANEYLSNPELSPEEKAKEARKARLALVKVRTGIEKKRKELNEEDQRKIADRNAIGKILTGLVSPTEALLQAEEDRAENEEKARKEVIKKERLEKLSVYEVDCTFFDLANMPEEAFSILLENSRLAFEKRKDEEIKAQEEKLHQETVAKRKEQLVFLGFKKHESGAYVHELFDVKDELELYSEEQWYKFSQNIINDINELNEARRKEKEAEENRLKAEKEKAEREAALLRQQEKERQEKHLSACARQEELALIKVTLDYQSCFDMTQEAYDAFYKEKNSDYQAEQNRLFIERKKKEREEALKKEQEEKEAEEKRKAALAPEKEKIHTWVNSNTMPVLNTEGFSEEGKKIVDEIFSASVRFNKFANDKINLLV